MVSLDLARKTGALVAALALAWTGCGSEGPAAPSPTGRLTVTLEHRVGAEALVLNSIRYTNAAGNHYRVDDLRYYISDLELMRVDGSRFTTTAAHLRDAAIDATRDWEIDGVPDGDYTAVRFLFGLDSLANHFGQLPRTTANDNMSWPELYGGGYHYMQLDGKYESTLGVTAWQAHLGRLQRPSDPVPLETHFWREFPVTLHVSGDAHRVEILMDVNGWFASPNLYDFDFFGGAVMDNPVAQRSLSENGPNAFSLGSVASASR